MVFKRASANSTRFCLYFYCLFDVLYRNILIPIIVGVIEIGVFLTIDWYLIEFEWDSFSTAAILIITTFFINALEQKINYSFANKKKPIMELQIEQFCWPFKYKIEFKFNKGIIFVTKHFSWTLRRDKVISMLNHKSDHKMWHVLYITHCHKTKVKRLKSAISGPND